MKKFGCIENLYMRNSNDLTFKKNKLYIGYEGKFDGDYNFVDELKQDHTLRSNYLEEHFLTECEFNIKLRKKKLQKINKKKF